MKNESEQELLMQASMIEQHMAQLNEQLNMVENTIDEMTFLSNSLTYIEDTKEKDNWTNLGHGIFLSSTIKEKKLLVQVGAGVFIKKLPSEAKKIISSQIKRMNEARIKLSAQQEFYHEALSRIVDEVGHTH